MDVRKIGTTNEYSFYNMVTKQWLALNNQGAIGLSPKKNQGQNHTSIKLTRIDNNHCSNFPESEVNATGQITKKTWPNGELWGLADNFVPDLQEVEIGCMVHLLTN